MGLLEGKIAIITGAGRGIGRAEALAMVKEGVKVVINDLGGGLDGTGKQAMIADEVVNEVTAMGGQAVVDYSDVGTLEGVDNMIWRAVSKFGRLDIMINNAGILRDKMLLNMEENDWDFVQKVHSKGTFLCTRAAARIMRAQGQGGVILNTTSMSGLIGNAGQANYSFAKAGMYGFTKTVAAELGRYGIRVHAICPNAYTRMTASLPALKGITEEMLNPVTVAPLAVFLASDLSKNLTGRVILAHGGTIGVKVAEFKMALSNGFNKKEGLPTAQDIADNIDRVMISEPDLEMMAAFKFE